MPEVTLEVLSLDSNPVTDRVCTFSGVGGTIGRDRGNSLVLEDKHRRVSRLHASITFPGGVATIANASTSLPISVGSTVLNHGQKQPIAAGDLIEIGPFVLRVRGAGGLVAEDTLIAHVQPTVQVQPIKLETAPTMSAAAPSLMMPPLSSPASDPLAAFMAPSGSAGGDDPFADLFADLAPATPSREAQPMPVQHVPVQHVPVQHVPVQHVPVQPAPPPPYTPPAQRVVASQPPLAPPSPALPPQIAAHAALPAAPTVFAAASAPVPPPMSAGGAGHAARIPADFDPFADLLGLGAGPLASNSAAGQVPPFAAPAKSDPFAPYPTAPAPASAIIPEDFNPFEMPSQTARNSADPLAHMLGVGKEPVDAAIAPNDMSIDALFAPSPAAGLDQLLGTSPPASPYAAPNINSLSAPVENADPLALFGAPASDLAAPIHSPMRDDLPEIDGAYQPPRAMFPQSRATGTSARVAPPDAWSAPAANPAPGTEALTQAFLQATGLPANALPGGLTPELMTVIGSLLRTATAGAIDMLAARAATKLEVQASVTIISSQSNNPLKFLPNAESALQQMLGKKMPGFMRADLAMRDAFDDLRAHEVGVIAGTRAALTEVLGRFDPAILEKRLAGGSLLDSLLPSMRKTKLWEIYLEQYAKIRREAEDDFQSIFGRSFLEAYEREAGRVKSHTTESGNNP